VQKIQASYHNATVQCARVNIAMYIKSELRPDGDGRYCGYCIDSTILLTLLEEHATVFIVFEGQEAPNVRCKKIYSRATFSLRVIFWIFNQENCLSHHHHLTSESRIVNSGILAHTVKNFCKSYRDVVRR
jgi:hypothetical protein